MMDPLTKRTIDLRRLPPKMILTHCFSQVEKETSTLKKWTNGKPNSEQLAVGKTRFVSAIKFWPL